MRKQHLFDSNIYFITSFFFYRIILNILPKKGGYKDLSNIVSIIVDTDYYTKLKVQTQGYILISLLS